MSLCELLRFAQNGSEDATLTLLEKFTPLLKKYAWKLNTEDAFEDLRCFLIELFYRINLDSVDTNDMV